MWCSKKKKQRAVANLMAATLDLGLVRVLEVEAQRPYCWTTEGYAAVRLSTQYDE